jgi:hypothetical protein
MTSGLAAIRDTARLTGIDLVAEYEATPGCAVARAA